MSVKRKRHIVRKTVREQKTLAHGSIESAERRTRGTRPLPGSRRHLRMCQPTLNRKARKLGLSTRPKSAVVRL